MRIVLDTNVLISALIKDGKPGELIDALLTKPHTLLISRSIIREFSRIAADERIRRYVNPEDATAFLRMLVGRGEIVRVTSRFRLLKTPDDTILRTAYDGQANLIVTGDRHLLKLRQFKGIRILTVSEVLKEIR